MTIAKRLLNWKVLAIAVALILIVACYFAARKVMVLDVELGMSREEVIAMMGKPTQDAISALDFKSNMYLWETVIIHQQVYRRSVTMIVHPDKGVTRMDIVHSVFGWSYQTTRQ